jgi:hypothetical protein
VTHTLVSINDPVARRILTLHPETKRAEVIDLGARQVGFLSAARSNFSAGSEGASGASPSVQTGDVMAATLPGTPGTSATNASCPQRSLRVPEETQLGERIIQGLKATGRRTQYTIPAGEIGNEQPIMVSSEQWDSPDLEIPLSGTRHDPMVGDTTYTVAQLDRSEPDPALFTPPSDYTVQDITPGWMKVVAPGADSSGSIGTQRESR